MVAGRMEAIVETTLGLLAGGQGRGAAGRRVFRGAWRNGRTAKSVWCGLLARRYHQPPSVVVTLNPERYPTTHRQILSLLHPPPSSQRAPCSLISVDLYYTEFKASES